MICGEKEIRRGKILGISFVRVSDFGASAVAVLIEGGTLSGHVDGGDVFWGPTWICGVENTIFYFLFFFSPK